MYEFTFFFLSNLNVMVIGYLFKLSLSMCVKIIQFNYNRPSKIRYKLYWIESDWILNIHIGSVWLLDYIAKKKKTKLIQLYMYILKYIIRILLTIYIIFI